MILSSSDPAEPSRDHRPEQRFAPRQFYTRHQGLEATPDTRVETVGCSEIVRTHGLPRTHILELLLDNEVHLKGNHLNTEYEGKRSNINLGRLETSNSEFFRSKNVHILEFARETCPPERFKSACRLDGLNNRAPAQQTLVLGLLVAPCQNIGDSIRWVREMRKVTKVICCTYMKAAQRVEKVGGSISWTIVSLPPTDQLIVTIMNGYVTLGKSHTALTSFCNSTAAC